MNRYTNGETGFLIEERIDEASGANYFRDAINYIPSNEPFIRTKPYSIIDGDGNTHYGMGEIESIVNLKKEIIDIRAEIAEMRNYYEKYKRLVRLKETKITL